MKMKWSVSGCTVINLVKLRGDGYYFFPISFMKCTRNWLNIVNFSLAKYSGEINAKLFYKLKGKITHTCSAWFLSFEEIANKCIFISRKKTHIFKCIVIQKHHLLVKKSVFFNNFSVSQYTTETRRIEHLNKDFTIYLNTLL